MAQRNSLKPISNLPQDHLSWRVAAYVQSNPSEVLTRGDIATKFGVDASMVDTLVSPAVTAGFVKVEHGTADGTVWRRPMRMRTAFPAPFTPSLAAVARAGRSSRRVGTRLDISTIRIEQGVPIPSPSRRTAQWDDLFAKMGPGDSFVVPAFAHGAVAHAKVDYQRRVPGVKFTLRKIDDTQTRVWRSA